MDENAILRMKKLFQLAEHDPSYLVWESSLKEFAQAFKAYTDKQPEEIRNFLYGYADSGRLMNQRLMNLACMHMTFPEEAQTK